MSAVDPTADDAVPAVTSRVVPVRTYVTWTALALMTVSSVASLRPAPTMALYRARLRLPLRAARDHLPHPDRSVSAELASAWSGGVFRWVTEGISPNMGFVAAWHQYAMTIFYYPTLLSFVASTLAYVIDPAWASSGVWTAVVIISVYWLGTLLALRGGIGVVAKLASSGVLIGTLIPGALLVILGIIFLAQGNPSAAPMTAEHLLPEWTGIASIVLIVSNFGAYSGMEMNAVHVNELKSPSKFPGHVRRDVLVLCILSRRRFILSSPPGARLTAGVLQAFEAVFTHFGIQFLTPIVGLAIVSASLAGFMTWLSGPSKSLLLPSRRAGTYRLVPADHSAGVQINILAALGVVTTAGAPLRLRPRRLGRLLDVHDDHDVGLPADVPMAVPGRDEPP